MKKQVGGRSVLIIFLGLIIGSKGFATEENVKWREKMQALAATMGELLPELVSKKGDPAIIEKDAKALSELSHELQPGLLNKKMAPPEDADPSLAIIAGKFSEDTKAAYRAIKAGNIEYGKNRLRTVTAYCIACHTRHDKGPNFPVFPLDPRSEKLAPEELAALYVATRQFDKGLDSFEALIKDKEFAKTKPFEWEHSVRNALALSVRVKNDPDSAKKVVTAALASPILPDYTRGYLTKWQKAIESWKSESRKKIEGETALLKEMRRLLGEAKSAQVFPVDRSAEVQYLRAQSVAHDLLRQAKSAKVKAEGLLTVGIVTEYLNNYVIWPMQEPYYDACVRQVPHTDLAMQCYERFEESTYLGYTGSAGTMIPEDVQVVVAELKALAKPKVK